MRDALDTARGIAIGLVIGVFTSWLLVWYGPVIAVGIEGWLRGGAL